MGLNKKIKRGVFLITATIILLMTIAGANAGTGTNLNNEILCAYKLENTTRSDSLGTCPSFSSAVGDSTITSGKSGNGISMDGSDYVQWGSSQQIGQDYSVAGWKKLNAPSGSAGAYPTILSHTTIKYWWILSYADDYAQYGNFTAYAGDGADWDTIQHSSPNWDDNTWHFWVVTHNTTAGASELKYYVDGNSIMNYTGYTSKWGNTALTLRMGDRHSPSISYDWHGMLDEIYFFDDYILTQEDIDFLYNSSNGRFYPFSDPPIINPSANIIINNPTSSQYINTNPITINYSINIENINTTWTCNSTYDGGINRTDSTISTNTSYQWIYSETTNQENTETLTIYCQDQEGNNATATRTWYYDDIAPRFTNSTYNGTTTTADQIWINNTFKDFAMSSTYTQLEDKYNETNTSLSGNFTYTYDLDITQYGIGTWYVWGNATDQAGNSIDYNTSFTIDPDANFLTIRAMNYLGITPLTLATIWENHTDTTQLANPFQNAITNYLNKDVWNLTIEYNISDYEAKHQDYNNTLWLTRHAWEHNITLNPSQLVLTFYQDGVLYNSKGFIADTKPQRLDFHNSSFVVVQQELEVGYVHVRFGDNSSGNWTQYYEYINDEKEHITEDLEVLNNADTSIHVQALGNDRVPIDDVQVRVQYMEYSSPNITDGVLLGQRLTDGDGQTFFIADSATQLLITFTKTGYDPVDVPITVGDESFTRTSPLQVFMAKSSTGVTDDVWMWTTPVELENTTNTIYMMILAQGKDRVQYQTDYMVTTGLSAIDITPTCDTLDRCQTTLTEGTHFLNTQSTTIHLYIDNVYHGNRTIGLKPEKIAIFEPPNINQTILAPILLIALIFVVAGVSIRFRSRNAGIATWTVGTLIMSLISPAFMALAVITLLGLAFKAMQAVTKE